MVFASFWLKVDADEFQKLCYACEEPDCYLYDIVNGYYRIRPGESISRDMRYWQRCFLDGVTMCMGLFDADRAGAALAGRRSWS